MTSDEPDRNPEGATPAFTQFPGRERRGGMEEIARRLDELVRAVSDGEGLAPPHAIKDGVLHAARRAWKARRERQRIFGPSIVADPGWDFLLDLFIARIEERKVSVVSLSSAVGCSQGTTLRWLAQLIEAKLISSTSAGGDPTVRQLRLTDEGLNLMCDYFLRTSPDLDAAAA